MVVFDYTLLVDELNRVEGEQTRKCGEELE